MSKVSEVLKTMLKTSTGKAMGDSGGAYGRHWERNQDKDFDNEKEVTLDVSSSTNEVYGFTVSLYHYLKKILDVDEICETFNKINVDADNWDSDYYGVSIEGAEYLTNLGCEFKNTENSYNCDHTLSQVIQYTDVEIDSEPYVLLQIHQGCDIRGGYTDAYLFMLQDYINPTPHVIGEIDGKQVSSFEYGYKLCYEQDVEPYVDENQLTLFEMEKILDRPLDGEVTTVEDEDSVYLSICE